MDKLTSILVVADRTDADRALLDKAVLLARSLGAQILLFSCDAALAKAIQHSHSSEDAEKSRQITLDEHLVYLRGLRAAVHAGDSEGVKRCLEFPDVGPGDGDVVDLDIGSGKRGGQQRQYCEATHG